MICRTGETLDGLTEPVNLVEWTLKDLSETIKLYCNNLRRLATMNAMLASDSLPKPQTMFDRYTKIEQRHLIRPNGKCWRTPRGTYHCDCF